MIEEIYTGDLEKILSFRKSNGEDLWAGPEKNLAKGSPFSTLDVAIYLNELGLDSHDPLMVDIATLIFSVWREEGRFKIHPKSGIYPCQTAIATEVLCNLGYKNDPRIEKSLEHFLKTQYKDGGWRCNKFSFGRGEETEYSNPLPTLSVLGAFTFTDFLNKEPALDRAVEFLLEHWVIRKPIGPCHYGIGTLFMQVEYPFRGYNLFKYVHTLSFYAYARQDKRFLEAFAMLQSKTVNNQIKVQRVVPKLAQLSFCKKGAISPLATKRWLEIVENVKIKI